MTTQTIKALQSLANGEVMTYDQIHQASGCNRKDLTNYMSRLEAAGFIEHKGYIYNERGRFAQFQITEEGRDRLGLRDERWAPLPESPVIKGESIVARAIRTQPNSVFSIGAML
jgi:DNA-binding Lrp family transcriptional regulator